MTEFKPTTQFKVTCSGSSRPAVEHTATDQENPKYIDLHLSNEPSRSKNINDYTVKFKGIDVEIIKLDGNTLTVEI